MTSTELQLDDPDTMNASEALIGFCGWLVSREKKTVMSWSDDYKPVVELVKKFIRANNLPEVREFWETNLTHPLEERHHDL